MFSSKNMTNYNKIQYSGKNIQALAPVVQAPVAQGPVAQAPAPVQSPVAQAQAPVAQAQAPVAPAQAPAQAPVQAPLQEPAQAPLQEPAPAPAPVQEPAPAQAPAPAPAPVQEKNDTSFTPFQKDKLFWCFYVLLNGFTEYEMHHTGHYAIEKAFKISSVEKLRKMKAQIKELKLKINEVEDELVNKEQISIKGLHVLCLVHNVSITYIYGKQYCEFFYGDTIKGIIQRNEKKEHSLLYEDTLLETIKQTHWFIENVQKPLKAPTAYTVKELQDICEKLQITLTFKQKTTLGQIVEKNKLKKELYEDILAKL